MATPRTDELLQYWLFLILFFKNHHKILHLEIKLIFLYFLGVAPKNRSESGQKIGRKKLSESVKNDKKLQSRKFEMSYDQNLFTIYYPSMRDFWKSVVHLTCDHLIFDPGSNYTRKMPK